MWPEAECNMILLFQPPREQQFLYNERILVGNITTTYHAINMEERDAWSLSPSWAPPLQMPWCWLLFLHLSGRLSTLTLSDKVTVATYCLTPNHYCFPGWKMWQSNLLSQMRCILCKSPSNLCTQQISIPISQHESKKQWSCLLAVKIRTTVMREDC